MFGITDTSTVIMVTGFLSLAATSVIVGFVEGFEFAHLTNEPESRLGRWNLFYRLGVVIGAFLGKK